MILSIKNVYVESDDGREILKGVNLDVKQGEFHVVMGPNGAGKTTLAKVIMGYPNLKITKGDVLVDGKSIKALGADKRARLGLFLQFQSPVEVEGVGFVSFIRSAVESISDSTVDIKALIAEVKSYGEKLAIPEGLIGRNLNQGFSGGEKKKAEILQMAVLKPKIAVLDEPDSGLDVDAIKAVAEAINMISEKNNTGLLVITHYSRILKYMKPKFVHILVDGRIVKDGGADLIDKLDKEGYESFKV